MKGRVIITGGSGMLGRALGAKLVAEGYEVIALSRRPEGVAGLPAGMRAEGWDARSSAGWGHLADGAYAIVGLVGENIGAGLWTTARKRRISESRVFGGQAVVQAVQEARVRPQVVLQQSGIGYYGALDDREVTEEHPAGDEWQSRMAIDWENSTAAVERLGVRRVVTRTALVLAPGSLTLKAMRIAYRLFVGGTLGSGRQWWSWIHVADQVRAVQLLLETPAAHGPFNVSAPQPLSVADFTRTIGRVMRRPSFMRVPAPLLRLALGEMATILVTGQRVLPRRLLDLGFTFQFPTLESALRDLLIDGGRGE